LVESLLLLAFLAFACTPAFAGVPAVANIFAVASIPAVGVVFLMLIVSTFSDTVPLKWIDFCHCEINNVYTEINTENI
jgi:hypothetical protein